MRYSHASKLAEAKAGRALTEPDDWAPVGRCNRCWRATHDPLEVGAMCGMPYGRGDDAPECTGTLRAASPGQEQER